MGHDPGIKVTATDLANDETGTRLLFPGDYCLVAAEPLYLADVTKDPDSITLVLKYHGSNPAQEDGIAK